jgi:hypothetical protein
MAWRFKARLPFRALSAALIPVLATIVVATVATAGPLEAEIYAVVVSSDVPVKSLTLDQLRRLFLFRERYWKPGLPVKLLFSEEGLEPQSFLLKTIYGRDYPSLRRLIVEKLYTEEIDLAPKVVASDELAVVFVGSGKGLIALIHASAARGTNARLVAIDGLLPDAAGYKLRR